MKAEIRPEPTTDEDAAIRAALAHVLRPEPDPRGPWWRLGVREALAAAPARHLRRTKRR